MQQCAYIEHYWLGHFPSRTWQQWLALVHSLEFWLALGYSLEFWLALVCRFPWGRQHFCSPEEWKVNLKVGKGTFI